MSEMVEKVARALAFVEGCKITGPGRHRASDEFIWRPGNPQMEEYAEKHWREHLTAAQFAIEAMRELPDEPGPRYSAGEYSRANVAAMIDDILAAR